MRDRVTAVAFTVIQRAASQPPQRGRTADGGVCRSAELPHGFAVTRGVPHGIRTPYPDATLYNPTSIGNFVGGVLKGTRNTKAQRRCLATLGGDALLAGSISRKTPNGRMALWFPYRFSFRANPSVKPLRPGWTSGLAQGAALAAFESLYAQTKDPRWRTAAELTFESYTVRLGDGGFAHELGGGLWFEEYPTDPPTTVLNGHFNAIVALDAFHRRTRDPRAKLLLDRAASATKRLLPLAEVPTAGGLATSYDLVRGYPAAPLRLATSSRLVVQSAAQELPTGPKPVTLAIGPPASDGPNLLRNSGFSSGGNRIPSGWRQAQGQRRYVRVASGSLSIVGSGRQWQTVAQSVPSSRIAPGGTYRLSWRGKISIPRGRAGASGGVVVVASCPGGMRAIGGNNLIRSRTFTPGDVVVVAPKERCSLTVILRQSSWDLAGTKVTYDDVKLTRIPAAARTTLVWPYSVVSAPTSRLTIRYTGVGELQAYENGRWWKVAHLDSTVPSTVTIAVSQRWTGRNLNYGYHEGHVGEVLALHRILGDPVFLTYAQRWRPLAPSREPLFGGVRDR